METLSDFKQYCHDLGIVDADVREEKEAYYCNTLLPLSAYMIERFTAYIRVPATGTYKGAILRLQKSQIKDGSFNPPVGMRLSFIMDTILRDKDLLPGMDYQQLCNWYTEHIESRIEKEADWLSTNNGTTYRLHFRPGLKK